MNKILFLDIDGVLNSDRSITAFASKPCKNIAERNINTIDPVAVALVNKLCEYADLKIVITSNHRNYFTDSLDPLENLKDYLSIMGLNWRRVIGYTDSGPGSRGEQIQRWFDNNDHGSKFVILDDVDHVLEDHRDNLVKVDPKVGFTLENFMQACEILGMHPMSSIYI